jgi:hypothetical protein
MKPYNALAMGGFFREEERDPHWDKVVALLDFDGGISDKAGGSWAINGSVSNVSDAQAFTGQSAYFNGGRVSRDSSSDFVFGTGDFTIEAFIRFHTAGRGYLYSNKTNTAAIILSQANGVVEIYGPGSWVTNSTTNSPSFPIGTREHFAVARSGNSWRVFRNGVVAITNTDSRSWGTALDDVSIGLNAIGTAAYPLRSYIDQFRITKGLARYTANFTPPNKPFPSR